MSNIAIIEAANLFPGLTTQEKSIVIASKAKKIKDLTENELHNLILEEYNKGNLVLGHSIDEQKLVFFLSTLKQDLPKSFPSLTTEEFKQVMYYGLRGEFRKTEKEVIYLNVALVFEWINDYKEKIRKEVIAKQIKFEEKANKVSLTPEEKTQLRIKYGIADLLEEYKKTPNIQYSFIFSKTRHAVLFDFLIDFKLTNPTAKERKDQYFEIKKLFKYRTRKSDMPREDRNAYAEFIREDFEQLDKVIQNGNKFFRIIVNECKKEMLQNFLKQFKTEQELFNFLKGKIKGGVL